MLIENNIKFEKNSIISYVHIPKSGGYTIREGLFKYFKREECLRLTEPGSSHYKNIKNFDNFQSKDNLKIIKYEIKKIPLVVNIFNKINSLKKLINKKKIDPVFRDFNSLDKDQLKKLKFISSSRDRNKYEKINGKKNFYIMIIRNPLERLQSLYFHARRNQTGKKPYILAAKKYNIDDYIKFLIDNRKIWVFNTYCNCISGNNNFTESKKIIDNIYYLAAPMEKINEFSRIITYNFFGKAKLFKIMNVGLNNPKKNIISDEIKDIVISNNQSDIELKKHIEIEFDRIYKKFDTNYQNFKDI